MDHKSFKKS